MISLKRSALVVLLLSSIFMGSTLLARTDSDPNDGNAEADAQADETTPPRSFDDLNQGLPDSIADSIRLKRGRNYIFFMVKEPTYAFDFRTAEKLRKALLLMETDGMDIGHSMLAWSCYDPASKRRLEGATGQTGESLKQSFEMLKQGWGMATFLSTFNDGFLNTPEEVDEDIIEAAEANKLRFVGVEVTPAQCGSLMRHLRRYANGRENAQVNFGFMQNPRKYEGAGCGSFAAVGLEQANLFPDSLRYLWRTVEVPKQLIGVGSEIPANTVIYPDYTTGKRVGVGKLTTRLWKNYPPSEKGIPMTLADPEMMIHMIQGLESSVSKRLGYKYKSVNTESLNLIGKLRVVRSVKDPWAHGGSREVELIPINSKFDFKAYAIEVTTDNWVKNFLRDGGRVRATHMYFKSGLIFEKP